MIIKATSSGLGFLFMIMADKLTGNYKELKQTDEQEGLSRRDIFKTCGYLGGLAGLFELFGVFALVSFANAEISMPEIRKLMNRSTVDDILQKEYDDGLIKKIEYDNEIGKTNFDELVYQKHLKPDEKKPGLVMFYGSPGEGDSNYEKREAIILKELSRKFKRQLLFASYNVRETKNINGSIKDIWQEITKNYNINASPSLAMYSTFDLANRETPQKNNGEIKQIDVLRGGPDENRGINEDWLLFLKDKWVPTNLTSLNNTYAWRFNNSGRKNRAFYTITR